MNTKWGQRMLVERPVLWTTVLTRQRESRELLQSPWQCFLVPSSLDRNRHMPAPGKQAAIPQTWTGIKCQEQSWITPFTAATPGATMGQARRGCLCADSSVRKDCSPSQCYSKQGLQTTAWPKLLMQVCEEVTRDSVQIFSQQSNIAVHFYCIGSQ